jgi:hypothetical protein
LRPLFPLYTFKPGNIPPNNERITKLHDKSDCDNPIDTRLTKKKHSLVCRQYIVKITSIFDNFRIFGVDSTHNELRDQLTSAQRNIVGTNIKKHHKY